MAKKENKAASPGQKVPQDEAGANKLVRVKVNQEELVKLEAEGKLVGYDREKSEALIYQKEVKNEKTV